jgi:hypothetical protein
MPVIATAVDGSLPSLLIQTAENAARLALIEDCFGEPQKLFPLLKPLRISLLFPSNSLFHT